MNREYDTVSEISADVVIVGCGAAGLYTALNIESGLKCVVLNKSGTSQANSMYAQGGIAAVIDPSSPGDDRESHFKDTLEAGAGLCDPDAVRVLVDEAWDNISELVRMGIPFDRKDGDLLLTREGGHSFNRILHSGGDATGLHLTSGLLEQALKRPNIRILDGIFLADILTDINGRAAGVSCIDRNNDVLIIHSPSVVIASGGIGRVFRNSTNASCATGDGIAAAARAGAELKDMEFVQFHPTALTYPDDKGRFFLISEALRGEGAVLRNREWAAFMEKVHPLKDLAPRDIVSRAIISEMHRKNIPNVYLDITSRSRDFLRDRFPTIYEECMTRGIDIARDWIPVIPVQHYFMGGIKTDTDTKTNLPGLYACGEAACTGVHGANRLASNSLLECLVFGRRCAYQINGSIVKPLKCIIPYNDNEGLNSFTDPDPVSSEIRNMATRKCGIIRKRSELQEAAVRINEIKEMLKGVQITDIKRAEAFNRVQIASSVIEASLKRKISVGAHYIEEE